MTKDELRPIPLGPNTTLIPRRRSWRSDARPKSSTSPKNAAPPISQKPIAVMEARRAPPKPLQPKPVQRAEARSVPMVAPKPEARPAPAPAPVKAAPVKQVHGVAEERVITRNGVKIDLLERSVTHRAKTVRLDDDSIRFVACLAKVMPDLLDERRIIPKVYGDLTADGSINLRRMVETLALPLADVRLEVRVLPKIGMRLHDQG